MDCNNKENFLVMESHSSDFIMPPSKMTRRSSSRMLKRISSVSSFDISLLSGIKTRKRKRKDVDEDTVSIQSLDVSPKSKDIEKKSKRRSMAKMSSLVNMLSPATSRVHKAFERSFSFKAPSSPHTTTKPITPYKKPKPANREQKTSRFWSDTVDADTRASLSSMNFKRQEAIFELMQGEEDLIDDLTMVDKLYRNSMRKLNLMTNEEVDKIFGIVERLVPFHQELVQKLKDLRNSDGTTDKIGLTMLDWVPNLRHYEEYCANQQFAKDLLDYKKTDPKVEDFLMRCQQSSFSRKLDLWNFLDIPRSRLVKYPLLLKQIHKYTDNDSEDKSELLQVIKRVEEIIQDVDDKMGLTKCKHAIDSLVYLYDNQMSPLIEQSTSILCSGSVKNDRGTKLHLYLFDQVMVITRQATRNGQLKYQVFKEPIPLRDLKVTDLAEVEGRKGSFKNKMLRHPPSDKHAFKISFRTTGSGQSHILQARDEHDKRQWVTSILKALETCGMGESNCDSLGQTSNLSSASSLCDSVSLSSEDRETMDSDITASVQTTV